jgi:anaerobic selenocysteine-containing dehydrogenase
LYEISNSNPVWLHTSDARRLGIATGDLVRVTTRIGFFVNKAWVTEGIRPGVAACSHHFGRWRLDGKPGPDRWASPPVDIVGPGELAGSAAPAAGLPVESRRYRMRRAGDIEPFASEDLDSSRIWWRDGGVHQNLTFPVQPDPVSGMHCWLQKVTLEKAHRGDRYGDIEVDPEAAQAVYQEWLALARPRFGPGGLRRPEWLSRPFRPSARAYRRQV